MRWPELSLLEIFLIQFIAWFGLWIYDAFMGKLLTSIVGAIVFAVLVIARISEAIEPTKVPKRYFHIMLISFLAPLLAATLFLVMSYKR